MEHISNTKAYKELEERRSKKQEIIDSYMAKLETLEKYLSEEYPKIETYFSEYTHHGWIHTIKVLEYMYDLVERPEQLTEEDIMTMIFVALLHDIGMALDEKEAKEFIRKELPDKSVVTEIIRAKHGELAGKKLEKIQEMATHGNDNEHDNKHDIKYYEKLRDVFRLFYDGSSEEMNDMFQMVAAICSSHTKSIHFMHQKWRNKDEAVYFACLLRLADLLDVDGSRAKAFQCMSSEEGYMHKLFNQVISDVKKIRKETETCRVDCPNRKNNRPCNNCYKRIVLTFSIPLELEDLDEAKARQMINSYKIEIESEILDVSEILQKMDEKYHIKLFSYVTYDEIYNQSADDLKINSHRLTVDYSAVKSIMFEKEFYRNKLHGMREIVQNAYDACKAFAELKHNERDWKAKITIIFDKSEDTIIIHDNGIGMTDFVIKEYFLNFGRSIYNVEIKYLYDDYHKEHIGHFGIGFFAAFMLSSKIVVRTQAKESVSSIKITLDKNDDFAILTSNCESMGHGTEIILNFNEVREALMVEDADECALQMMEYIQDTFLYDGISICGIIKGDEEKILETELRNISAGENSISKFLFGIDADVDIYTKEFPPIFYAKTSNDLQRIEYDELLIKLREYKKTSGEFYYLDAGNFFIFPGCSEIENDFKDQVVNKTWRRNYSHGVFLSDSIKIENNIFYEKEKLGKPLFCEYKRLDLLVKGNGIVLSDRDVICARKKNIMRQNDACGEVPRDDKIYIRNVYLPSLHISLPSLNFRYDLNGIVANIKTDNVFPTIMRDTLTDERAKELSYAIGAAITRLKDDEGFDMGENELIIKNLYNKKTNNVFIKEDTKE